MAGSWLGGVRFPVPPSRIVLLGILFFLPTGLPSIFGWLSGLLAIPVAYPLLMYGPNAGTKAVMIGLGLAGLGALVLQEGGFFLCSLSFVVLGFVLFHSARIGDSAAVSGGKGVVVLSLASLLYWGVYGVVADTNVYTMLLQALDQGLQQTLTISTSPDAGLPPDILAELSATTETMRASIPRMLPGLLATMALGTVWLNMVLVNNLVDRRTGRAPWGIYATWILPDSLVWVPIAAAITLLFAPEGWHDGAVWVLMVAGTCYLFQGLAVLMFLMERWRVPPFVRAIIYVVCFVQSFGMLLLTLLGLIEVWANLRTKMNSTR